MVHGKSQNIEPKCSPKVLHFGSLWGSWALIFLTFGGVRFGVVFWVVFSVVSGRKMVPKWTLKSHSWGPKAAKTAKKEGPKSGPKKGRSQGGPSPISTFPAWPKEGDKGGGKPPPLGVPRFGGLQDLEIWKPGKKENYSTRRPEGSADSHV